LAEVWGDIPHSSQANTGIVPQIGYEGFLTNLFQFFSHLIVRRYTAVDTNAVVKYPTKEKLVSRVKNYK
jgi:hypothetical protein